MKNYLSRENFGLFEVLEIKTRTTILISFLFMFSLTVAGKTVKINRSKSVSSIGISNMQNSATIKTNSLSVQGEITVAGKVVDEKGLGIPGVTVVVKGLKNGTSTDIDGNYKIAKVSTNATLVFTFMGMETQEVSVNGKKTINVKMKDATTDLNEIVVIGYGTARRKDLTGRWAP